MRSQLKNVFLPPSHSILIGPLIVVQRDETVFGARDERCIDGLVPENAGRGSLDCRTARMVSEAKSL